MPHVRTPASLAVSRMIAASLIAGVTVFALVAWFMVRQDGPRGNEAQASLMLYLWAALAFGAIMAAIVLWRVRIAPILESPASPAEDPVARSESLQSGLIIVWALLEGPALFGVVLYLLFGSTIPWGAGLLLVWLGIGLTFPRPGWYPSPSR